MAPIRSISRVVLVVLDGLRPDAIDAFHMRFFRSLVRTGASTLGATTVAPSVTAAAMTSLLTGVHPDAHGLCNDRFHIPRSRETLFPLPRVLHDAGIPTFAFLRRIPWLARPLMSRVTAKLGVTRVVARGTTAPSTVAEVQRTLRTEPRGLFLVHWGDADQAGHDVGWMSDAYGEAAKRMDDALALLCTLTGILYDPSTLLIVMADHGGGGTVPTDHDSDHPYDRTIPIVLCGTPVVRGVLRPSASLLDVPATVLRALDVAIPSTYAGHPFDEALATTTVPYAIAS